ncbi:uncharacterized protein LOC124083046 [Marmota monax]|uniref:uncharacterized protein LOC124083046 n=1 Tax=Marmota monax TaxID=9995 RepID=UPI001EAFBD07|nr:uncharacterized protein LOC124083046 [Marmota monax]
MRAQTLSDSRVGRAPTGVQAGSPHLRPGEARGQAGVPAAEAFPRPRCRDSPGASCTREIRPPRGSSAAGRGRFRFLGGWVAGPCGGGRGPAHFLWGLLCWWRWPWGASSSVLRARRALGGPGCRSPREPGPHHQPGSQPRPRRHLQRGISDLTSSPPAPKPSHSLPSPHLPGAAFEARTCGGWGSASHTPATSRLSLCSTSDPRPPPLPCTCKSQGPPTLLATALILSPDLSALHPSALLTPSCSLGALLGSSDSSLPGSPARLCTWTSVPPPPGSLLLSQVLKFEHQKRNAGASKDSKFYLKTSDTDFSAGKGTQSCTFCSIEVHTGARSRQGEQALSCPELRKLWALRSHCGETTSALLGPPVVS